MAVQSRLAPARRRTRPVSLPFEEAVTHVELDQHDASRLLALLVLVTAVATADVMVGDSVVLIVSAAGERARRALRSRPLSAP